MAYTACVGDIRKASNGCKVAKRVPRKKSGFRVPSCNIAAIDFGTTNCSVAYTTVGSGPQEAARLLPLQRTYNRVPTAILFKPDGSIDSFGYDARTEYLNLDNQQRLKYAFFEQIKMTLQHDKKVNREVKIKAKNGNEYYLVDVIAQILKYLKIALIEKLKHANIFTTEHSRPRDLEATDFDWVITVPAIWRARGKQMMREAGYKAGLCSQEACGDLRKASALLPAMPNEKNPHKLSLALEPECAAIYCQNVSDTAAHCPAQRPYQSTCYLVVDIGGGTVDISAHKLSSIPDRYIQVVHPPTGNDCGGSRVNKEFEQFLERLVNDKGFARYLHNNDPVTNAKHSADLNELINETFEEQKVIFGNKGGVGARANSRLAIRLPHTFLEVYKDNIDDGIRQMDGQLEQVGQDLRIKYSMMADLFKSVVEGMVDCISQTLTDAEAKVDTIYLVGGFGGSKYIYNVITQQFGNSYRYITPEEPDFAVIHGAVFFRKNPDIVRARKVDATYGVGTNVSFDPLIHNPKYKWINDDGEEECSNIFSTVVERGDLVCTEEVFSQVFVPVKHQQTRMSIEIYSTLEKDVWYTTGKRGRGSRDTSPVEIRKVGEFEVQMPVLIGDKNRKVDVTFDFSHTEIQVKGYDRTSGNEVKAGLCSKYSCGRLKLASQHWPCVTPEESSPDKLALALEPEAAAIYCQNIPAQQLAPYCKSNQPFASKSFLVVDIGGGTVDITAYRISSSPEKHIEVVLPAIGNDCGGSMVNKNFEKFLGELVDDETFSQYLDTGDETLKATHRARLNELINITFERQKIIFGERGGVGSRLSIRLPDTFLEHYQSKLVEGIRKMDDSQIELSSGDLRIAYPKMKEFFQPVVEGLLQCMTEALLSLPEDEELETIYIVGGFGGSKYIYNAITEEFGDRYKYITPTEHDFAVVRGAVLFRQNPNIVYARRADATYGVRVSIPFQEGKHEEDYKWVNDKGDVLCENIFSTFVERGDIVPTSEVIVTEYVPAKIHQRQMHFDIYSSSEKDVWYTTGRKPNGTDLADVQKIGELMIPFPKQDTEEGAQGSDVTIVERKVEVTFDFSHTEIQVRGYDKLSHTEIKVVLDFLST